MTLMCPTRLAGKPLACMLVSRSFIHLQSRGERQSLGESMVARPALLAGAAELRLRIRGAALPRCFANVRPSAPQAR